MRNHQHALEIAGYNALLAEHCALIGRVTALECDLAERIKRLEVAHSWLERRVELCEAHIAVTPNAPAELDAAELPY